MHAKKKTKTIHKKNIHTPTCRSFELLFYTKKFCKRLHTHLYFSGGFVFAFTYFSLNIWRHVHLSEGVISLASYKTADAVTNGSETSCSRKLALLTSLAWLGGLAFGGSETINCTMIVLLATWSLTRRRTLRYLMTRRGGCGISGSESASGEYLDLVLIMVLCAELPTCKKAP